MTRARKWELESVCVFMRERERVCVCVCVRENASYDIFIQRFEFMELAQFFEQQISTYRK